ncbi:MAG: SGNH/GDSL hydrolase family protein [Acidobacteria bacterium]|nr:SGNH/GDSL hydrolase family protein [Acidobacteriota bacterium]
MKRRDFLKNASVGVAAASAPRGAFALPQGGRDTNSQPSCSEFHEQPKDYKKTPFRRLVILGESTVEGGPWLHRQEDRYADVLVGLINACQKKPIEYYNKGIGNNAISPRSPGYGQSAKPSALERYHKDVIDLHPDLFILAYGLNDMRAGMPLTDFREDMATIISNVQKACSPVTVLTTVYYMTGYGSWPPLDRGSIELTRRYNDCIRGLAAEFDCILADVWASEGQSDWLIHYDGVHANQVGELLIGNRIFEALAQHASGLTNWTFDQQLNTQWTQRVKKGRAEARDPFKKTW